LVVVLANMLCPKARMAATRTPPKKQAEISF
jgi:hypothetical protein